MRSISRRTESLSNGARPSTLVRLTSWSNRATEADNADIMLCVEKSAQFRTSRTRAQRETPGQGHDRNKCILQGMIGEVAQPNAR